MSPEDYEWANSFLWCRSAKGYATRTIHARDGSPQRQLRLHVALMERILGRALSPRELVDHHDRVPWNNRRSNLRIVTKAQNNTNKASAIGSSSIHKGVYRRKDRAKFLAAIKSGGTRINIGSFVDELEAAYMYDCYASALHDEYAVLNFDYCEVPRQDKSAVLPNPVKWDTPLPFSEVAHA
ncbi:hypothetical protein G6039_18865 [Rhodococcus aetherivorans]|nr:hypothetical protein [Rhodococcus aetherivorans]